MRPVKLTGRVAALRELDLGDVAALHAVYGDPAVAASLSFEPRTVDQCESIIASAIRDAEADPRIVYMLAVTDLSGSLIGAARLALGDWSSGQFGMAIGAAQQGRGVGTDALRLLFRLGFGELGLHRIWGARTASNQASARLMAAAGMTPDGTIRSHVLRHGKWDDSATASILADEFTE
jgi:ribosomal-protein-alanine N-acetyltransferase